MKKQLLMMAMGLMMVTAVHAQEEPKVSIKPTGRILLDAAYVKPQHEEDGGAPARHFHAHPSLLHHQPYKNSGGQ